MVRAKPLPTWPPCSGSPATTRPPPLTCGWPQALHRDLDDRYKQAWTRTELGVLQRLTGDNPAAEASQQQALEQWRDIADHSGQARSLNELGLVQQLTGDYPAAETSHLHALTLYRDLGRRQEQAEVLNSLGELSSRCTDGQAAREPP